MRMLGAVVLVPTSMPTWHMMPMKQSRMKGRLSSLTQAPMPEALSGRSSSMGVAASRAMDRKLTTAYITKRARQPRPKVGKAVVAPQAARMGARNEAMALTNWPKVRVEASLSLLMRLVTRGLSDVCMTALPMPNSEKEASIII